MYGDALLKTYQDTCILAALCDSNRTRLDFSNLQFRRKHGAAPLPGYGAGDFDGMVAKEAPDVVIVTSMDSTHHHYIIRAMELGCDVITEKPMTTDAEKCRAILETVQRTGRSLRVAFNYRYAPARSRLKELLLDRVIGEVKSVHFEWLLDTKHGADYFRRWHRVKENSGGLMVHKATHHFDLMNWWLESTPETVFGFGSLAFYGRKNAEARGEYRDYSRGTGHPAAQGDPFALNLRDGSWLEGMYLNAESEDGYKRDQNVFGEGIDIEDTMNVLVRYKNGVQLSYTLTAYAPWEGLRIAFNGTKGRIELEQLEKSYISAGTGHISDGAAKSQRLVVLPHWKKPYEVAIPEAEGGHGGGDRLLLEDLFQGSAEPDLLRRSASHLDGAMSILTGIAANQSFVTGLPVNVDLATL